VLRLESSRVLKRLRSHLGLSREAVAGATDATPKAVRLWEDGESSPRLHQVAFAPADIALPLFAWGLAQHGHHAHAVPALVHGSDAARVADLMRATADADRAVACLLEGEANDIEWERIRSAAHRVANAACELEARAASELQQRRLR
jgi:DNA-binding XRE family transcriptional regulator